MSEADDVRPVHLVTGAAGGIGLAIARLLARDGAVVAASDRREDELESAVRTLREDGLDVRPVPADITDSASVTHAVERVEAELGPITGLAHAAGVLHPAELLSTADEEGSGGVVRDRPGPLFV